MILYLNDWGRYPNAVVHTTTKNKSFIKMHYILKDMGIKNNAFFLSLLQPELLNVDPWDLDNITPEIAVKIAVECKINPWYYLREIVRVPASGTDPIPFKFNRASLFIYWMFYNSVNLFVIQPRQTGKTVTSQTLIAQLIYFVYKSVRIKLFTHSNKLIHENVEKLKIIRDEFPPYLIDLDSKLDTDNKEELSYDALSNTYVTTTAQQSIAGAFGVGRGGTVLVNHLDEAPFCSNIRISYPVLMNAKNAAVGNAKEHNIPHADIITTTAGLLDTDSGEYVHDILTKCLVWNEKLLDLSSNAELRHVVNINSRNRMVFAEFSFRQLEFTKEWADDVIRENNLEGDEAERDLYNTWTIGGGKPAVDAELLNKIVDSKIEPVEVTIHDNYIFNWYEKEKDVWSNKDRFFVIGMDTSDNIGEDFTTVHMLDISDLSTVMTSRCNDEDLTKLSSYIAKLLINHPNIVLIPERKSTASVLISLICAELWNNNINPFTRIYNRVFQNRNEKPFDKIDISTHYATQGPTKKYIGYPTSGTGENSRSQLYKLTLGNALKMSWSDVRDANLIHELRGLTIHKNSKRIDHGAGRHDDSVMAYLLASWFVIHGRNLHLYGVPNHIKLSKVSSDGEQVDVTKKKRQRELHQRIKLLTIQMKHTGSHIVRGHILQELNLLRSQLSSITDSVGVLETPGDKQVVHSGVDAYDFVSGIQRPSVENRFLKQVNDPLRIRDSFKRNSIWETM